jgi:hypothetical protein
VPVVVCEGVASAAGAPTEVDRRGGAAGAVVESIPGGGLEAFGADEMFGATVGEMGVGSRTAASDVVIVRSPVPKVG